jgi:maleylacetoacetate isomerase
LAVKEIPFESVPVSLLDGSSESPEHLLKNPAGFVPVLEIPGKPPQMLTESLAILLYLETVHPELPSLLPSEPLLRARTLALAETVNSGIQPLHNPPTLERHSRDPAEQKAFARHFIRKGLEVYETLCSGIRGKFSVGDDLSIADLCLSPQLYSATRFEVDFSDLSGIRSIEEELRKLPAWHTSHPDRFKPVDFKG